MFSFTLMVVVFVIGYVAIALEHPLKIDKASSALILGVLIWVIYILNAESILSLNLSSAWSDYLSSSTFANQQKLQPDASLLDQMKYFIVDSEIIHHFAGISEILFFLLGAMTIVETVDHHNGFSLITDKITTKNKVKLMWILSILAFFMSALLDNLTTTIVMIALLAQADEYPKNPLVFRQYDCYCCQCRRRLVAHWRCYHHHAVDWRASNYLKHYQNDFCPQPVQHVVPAYYCFVHPQRRNYTPRREKTRTRPCPVNF